MTQEPSVTRLQPGVSWEPAEGHLNAHALAKRAGGAGGRPKAKRTDLAARGKGMKRSPEQRENISRGIRLAKAKRVKAAPYTIEPTVTVSFVPAPDRSQRLRAALDELKRERDGLDVVIAHLERLVG